MMIKRTIKQPAGKSTISIEDATQAARLVFRSPVTGKLVVAPRGTDAGELKKLVARERLKNRSPRSRKTSNTARPPKRQRIARAKQR
jgi:hypothetical protein